jgi:hypothetical protein
MAKTRDIFESYRDELERIGQQLATNFDAPAQRIINAGFARMGIDRFTQSGNDLWEMYVAQLNGWEYQRPPRHLQERWARY